jgi:cobalt-zinc-cadmium resistance protein CzcA
LIDRLLILAVRQRSVVLLLAAVTILLGTVAAIRVPIDAVPDVTNVQVQVITPAPGLGPEDMETYVTFPVEQAMAGLPGLEEIRSISRPGISCVTLAFQDDIRLLDARAQVAQRLTAARANIPEGYGEPELGPMSSGLGEVLHFEVRGPGHTLTELRSLLDWQIAPRLKLVPGVVEVNAFGGQARSLELALDADRMRAAHVGVPEVTEALKRAHVAVGGAYLVQGQEHVSVRGEGRIRTAADLESVAVATAPGRAPLYLRDLGVAHESSLVRQGAVTRDGRGEAVLGVVMMRIGAHSGEVVDASKDVLADVQKSLPPGVTLDAYYERTTLVNRTIQTVVTNVTEAIVLVIAVLLLMLMSLRAGMVVALVIPLALLGVFIGMYWTELPGNLVSLGAIDFGLVVDGSVIVVENALRRMAERRAHLGRTLTDDERSETVIDAAREVRSASAFGEVIIAVVYVPILALQGVEGRTFRPMAMTVLFALIAGFILSLTVVPALASLLLSRDTVERQSPLVRIAKTLYRPVLGGAIRWPWLSTLLAVILFALSAVTFARQGREFLPKLDEGTVVIAAVRLPSVSLDQSLAMTTRIEQTLRKFPEVVSVVSRTGRAEIAVDPMGVNMTDVYVLLKPRETWRTATDREGLVDAFDKALSAAVPATGFSFTQPIEMNTNDLLAGISSDLALHLYGPDLGVLRHLSERVVQKLRVIPGAADVRAEQVAGSSALAIVADRPALARHGVTVADLMQTVEALGGIQVGTVVTGNERYPIQVRMDAASRTGAEAVAQIPLRGSDGHLVPLAQVARMDVVPAPSQISRERLQRRVTVQLNVRGRDLGSFVEEARGQIEREVPLPPGYSSLWAGDYERLVQANARLMVVVPVAILIILVLLVSTFGRMGPALLILLNVPLAVSGGIFALAWRGMPFSISAGVGTIALLGVAVLNGLVLVSTMERLRANGLDPRTAATQAAEIRLRPVLTTALVASLGFLPMALATGAGAEVQRPIATVVMGGLLTSTLLTLLVLPALYARLMAKSTPLMAKSTPLMAKSTV